MVGLKGVRMQRYSVVKGAMVGGHKCGRFKRSEDAKVQCQEGVIMGDHKCGRFERSEDVKV